MRRLGIAVLAILHVGPAFAQTPTPPDPTPTPAVTPTPDPSRPPGIRADDATTMLVSALEAPDNYYNDRDRGLIEIIAGQSNYSHHRVILPAERPLTIQSAPCNGAAGCLQAANFTQALTRTVVFWRVDSSGTDLGVALRTDRALPDGRTALATDAGCWLRLRGPGGWTRNVYTVTGIVGSRWQLDRNASVNPNISGALWQLFCPVKNFSEITLRRVNLRNTWLPTVRDPPIIDNSPNVQGDLP